MRRPVLVIIAHRPLRGVHATVACPGCDANEYIACPDPTCNTEHPLDVDGPAERFLDRHACDGAGWERAVLDGQPKARARPS